MYQRRPTVFGVEDCLYLAVYTHDTKGKAPVLFHLHGGGFIAGNGPHKTDPRYLMDEDVVVVVVNYRVGIMGFLSFEDNVMPGNQGLKDQVMALRWVKNNIAKFGGDPNKVTLVGESAGAASVYHHTISPLSKGLFHRGIAESGSSYNMRCIMPPGMAKERAQKLAELVSCRKNNSKEATDCLLKKDAKELVGHMEDFRAYTDSWYTSGIFDAANKHTGDVYFYYFDYRGEFSFFPSGGNKTQYAIGASHTDEIIYLWHNKNFASNLKGEDLELSKKLVKIWTDFAKFG
ncbi:unnamed protein product [Nezara viridula]|uniref:Carboxylic ester hydrolase n=1 Tax=Nezara viridula TaxID=85310 RepID=A0A9P0HBE3_NEZVI|nr:unnamed protein product [Nezara viridula]